MDIFMALVGPWIGSLFYAMAMTPFAVWAGRSAFAGAAARGYPGHGRTFWLAILPATLIAYGLSRGFDTSVETSQQDEWGQLLFLLTAPCFGMILGYGLGWLFGLAARKRG